MATVKQKARNQRVIERLEAQLVDDQNNKTNPKLSFNGHPVPKDLLSDKDITRITKEIEVLKTRI